MKSLHGCTRAVKGLAFSPDCTTLAAGSSGYEAGADSGDIKLFDLKSGRLLLSLGYFGSDTWIAWSPDGYYSGSDGVESFLTCRKGTEILPMEKCKRLFYRPDVIREIMAWK